MLCIMAFLRIEGDPPEGLKNGGEKVDLKSKISELNSVPELSFVLREEGQKSPQLWTFLTGT